MGAADIFLIAVLIIYTAPYLIWRVCRTEYFAPLVVVQIIGGVVLGPGVLGAIFPGYYRFVFNPQSLAALNGIAWWAVMLFVWVAGLELDLKQAWVRRAETGVAAGFALATPLLLGAGAAAIFLSGPGWAGQHAQQWQVVAGIGMSCAVTSLPILVLFLEKLDILRRPLGQRVLRYASLDDIVLWVVLALIIADWGRVGRQVAFLAAFAVASLLIRKLIRRVAAADRWYIGLVWLAACSLAADWAGLDIMVGAFLSGAVLDGELFGRESVDRFRDVILLAFMPVYFLSAGLRTTWSVGGVAVFGAAALLLAASVLGKLIGVHIAGSILNWRKGESGLIGWLLQTKALIMIIFSNILLDKGIISNATFTALLLMAVASTMLAIPMASPRLRRLSVASPQPTAPAGDKHALI
jgi:Kef-type K+ transport system membrane component KefB